MVRQPPSVVAASGEGAEKLLPRVAAGPVKAVRESTQGVTQANNQPVYYGNQRLRAGMIDAAIRAAGFSPARLAVVREKQWNERQVEGRYEQACSDIYRRVRGFYLQDPYARDPREWAEVLELIRDYNARVQRSGADTVPFITAETLRRVANQAQVPPRRERLRDEPKSRSRIVPALPEEPAPGRAGRSRRSRPT
jgi:hypothetical protein